ncbi:hypothetical protein BURK1_01866 [Burkholderiales bacterium]|nr:hypothetical protein BURK1_01866 [Burkholderiales bacterium]
MTKPSATAILVLVAGAALLATAPASAQPGDGRPQALPATKIRVGPHTVTAEVAGTPEQRTIGLMYRFSLPADHGMLFVFAAPQPLAFWMRNTYIPLSIAYIDADGRILNVADMAPRDESTHASHGAALYALEMRKGWFAERRLGPGTRVTGLPPPAAR